MLKERAIEVFKLCNETSVCGPWSDQLAKHLTGEETQYVKTVWETLSGNSSFACAFLEVVNNGETLPEWIAKLSKACGDYAEAMVNMEIKAAAENRNHPGVDESMLTRIRNRQFSAALKLATEIQTKSEAFVQSCQYGRFFPVNKVSRKFFVVITGLTLPPTIQGTKETLRRYAPEAFKQSEDNLIRIARELAELENRELENRIAETQSTLLAFGKVDVTAFTELLKYHAIEVHPRTMGLINRRIVRIGLKNAEAKPSRSNQPPKLDKVWDIIDQLLPLIKGKE